MITIEQKVTLNRKLPLWYREFPELDEIPILDCTVHDTWYGDSTWIDTSWHNDTCPSFESYDLIPNQAVKIFSDFADEDKREMLTCDQYSIHLYTKFTEKNGEESCVDFMTCPLSTSSREEVYNWILERERENEMRKREDKKMQGKRKATLQDMIDTRDLCLNLCDALGGDDPSLDGACGFVYYGSYFIKMCKTGLFYTMAGNKDILTDTLVEAELWLWSNFVEGEAPLIDLEKREFVIVFDESLYPDAETKIVPFDFFCDGKGYYDTVQIFEINEMAIGESCIIGGIAPDNTIYRTK